MRLLQKFLTRLKVLFHLSTPLTLARSDSEETISEDDLGASPALSSCHPFLLKAEYIQREPYEDTLQVIVKKDHILPIYECSLKERIKNFHPEGFCKSHPLKAWLPKLSEEVKKDVKQAVAMNVLSNDVKTLNLTEGSYSNKIIAGMQG